MEDDLLDALDAGDAAELFGELARQGIDGRLARLDFAAGEFPLKAHRLIGAALRQEDAAGVVAAERGDDQFSGARRGIHGCAFCVISGASYLDAPFGCAYGSAPRSQE